VTELGDPWLSDVLGDPMGARVAELGAAALVRNGRRAQRATERDGRSRGGVRVEELATGIALALRRGDEPVARELIAAGGRFFGNALIMAVGQASEQLEAAALRESRRGS
jgi:hypothetical protein